MRLRDGPVIARQRPFTRGLTHSLLAADRELARWRTIRDRHQDLHGLAPEGEPEFFTPGP
jgi:hypothetical protein